MIPHIIVFKDPDCQGKHLHLFDSDPDLPKSFDNAISSIVVLKGIWAVYDKTNFEGEPCGMLSKGIHSFGKKIDLSKLSDEQKKLIDSDLNDLISSIKLVE